MHRTRIRNLAALLTRAPESETTDLSRALVWIGLLVALVASGVPLVQGLATGWPIGRIVMYSSLMVLYLVVTQAYTLSLRVACWMSAHVWLYLLIAGFVCLALQISGGDPFIQPMAFGVPLVYAAFHYTTIRIASVAAFYLGLMVLGIWLSGSRHPDALIFPLIGYGMMMVMMQAFIRLSMEQSRARQRADHLAADLTRQRDYLAHLVEITATLTHNLELTHVLEQVAAAGRTLACSEQVRVWLHEPVLDDQSEETQALASALSIRLATAVPSVPQPVHPTAEEQQVLLASSAYVSDRLLVLPLLSQGASIGALELCERSGKPFSQEDVALLEPFANAAAIAIQNARLYEQARLSATLAERNRLARELHDTIAQGLTAAVMQLEAAQRSFARDPDRTLNRLERARELARETLDDVRRSVWTLAAPLVDGYVLSETLHEQVLRFRDRTGVLAYYSHTGPPLILGHAAATQVLRIVQEALQNVEKHAQAREVIVRSEASQTGWCIEVQDDGTGFDVATMVGREAEGGFGLVSMRERARLAGGDFAVESSVDGGTRIRLTLPMPATAKQAE